MEILPPLDFSCPGVIFHILRGISCVIYFIHLIERV